MDLNEIKKLINEQKLTEISTSGIELKKQWEQEVGKIFQNFPYLTVSGGVNVSDIAHFLENNKEQCIVITTYASSHKVLDASMRVSFVFNMKILD